MSRQTILSKLKEGVTIAQLVKDIDGTQDKGKPLKVTVHPYAAPYLDHTVAGFTDGPPTSTVNAIISAATGHDTWRRMTISKAGPWHYELACLPTEFGDPKAPLAPGIPPGPTLKHHH
jgi:hypothetical protein